tara:strand:+ start:4578 stop:5006 length:429 start_codon:yes stop_codon:yes gene_type:complete
VKQGETEMVFGRKKVAMKRRNMITLTNIATGHSYEYEFNPNGQIPMNIERMLKEFDDEGFPLFFADEKIPNLPVRVRNKELEDRMKHYAEARAGRMSTFNSAALDKTAQTKLEKQLAKKKDGKAAKAVKPEKKTEKKEGSDE